MATVPVKPLMRLLKSLIKLVADKGIDWLYANSSIKAQRGALDWKGKFRDAVAPVFAALYESVANGTEAKILLEKIVSRTIEKN